MSLKIKDDKLLLNQEFVSDLWKTYKPVPLIKMIENLIKAHIDEQLDFIRHLSTSSIKEIDRYYLNNIYIGDNGKASGIIQMHYGEYSLSQLLAPCQLYEHVTEQSEYADKYYIPVYSIIQVFASDKVSLITVRPSNILPPTELLRIYLEIQTGNKLAHNNKSNKE